MCDCPGSLGNGWRGWLALPAQENLPAGGPWFDLSHKVGPQVPRASVFPKPSFRRLKSLPADPLNVTEIQMVVHIGTHVDAPRHFFNDGPAFHEIPLDRLTGPGVVISFAKAAGEMIEVSDFMRSAVQIMPGDIVALETGWAKFAQSPVYHDHPYLSPAAAQWLVERKVKLVACDLPTPDMPLCRRPGNYDWPTHHVLLANGVLVAENLTGLEQFAGERVEFVFSALNIEESDGAPARIIARRQLTR